MALNLMHVEVSVKSNIKEKLNALNQMGDFTGCNETKPVLINEACITLYDEQVTICKAHKENLEKTLDCKDSCKDFYKKYNDA